MHISLLVEIQKGGTINGRGQTNLEASLGLVLEDVSYQSGDKCGNWADYVLGGCIVHTVGNFVDAWH